MRVLFAAFIAVILSSGVSAAESKAAFVKRLQEHLQMLKLDQSLREAGHRDDARIVKLRFNLAQDGRFEEVSILNSHFSSALNRRVVQLVSGLPRVKSVPPDLVGKPFALPLRLGGH